eukprot:3860423-Pleurochrysis_carterae.AAC.1
MEARCGRRQRHTPRALGTRAVCGACTVGVGWCRGSLRRRGRQQETRLAAELRGRRRFWRGSAISLACVWRRLDVLIVERGERARVVDDGD